MTIQLELQADVERGLLAQAERHGMSLAEYVQQIIVREARQPASVSAGRVLPVTQTIAER